MWIMSTPGRMSDSPFAGLLVEEGVDLVDAHAGDAAGGTDGGIGDVASAGAPEALEGPVWTCRSACRCDGRHGRRAPGAGRSEVVAASSRDLRRRRTGGAWAPWRRTEYFRLGLRAYRAERAGSCGMRCRRRRREARLWDRAPRQYAELSRVVQRAQFLDGVADLVSDEPGRRKWQPPGAVPTAGSGFGQSGPSVSKKRRSTSRTGGVVGNGSCLLGDGVAVRVL